MSTIKDEEKLCQNLKYSHIYIYTYIFYAYMYINIYYIYTDLIQKDRNHSMNTIYMVFFVVSSLPPFHYVEVP